MVLTLSCVPPKHLGMLARVEERPLSPFRVQLDIPPSMLLPSVVHEVGVFHGKIWVGQLATSGGVSDMGNS